jgi:hypothetical protein
MNPIGYEPLPLSLKIVAILFILMGVSDAITILGSLMQNHIDVRFGVLGIFIGPGLLRLKAGWRTCALVFTWLSLILAPIVRAIKPGRRGAFRGSFR